MLREVKRILNGDMWQNWYDYECDNCGLLLPECDPRMDVGDGNYCRDCAYVLGFISEEECKENFYFSVPSHKFHLNIVDGKVEFVYGKRRTKKQQDRRTSPEYASWRLSVYERDGFTCRECGVSGVELNAHHVLSYRYYPDNRLDTDNGITLCIPCHKLMHKNRTDSRVSNNTGI